MKKRMLGNALSSVLIYGALLLLGLVTSKSILIEYGSETNGLLTSINQIFSYIALLEAGIGTATITALYKPLADKKVAAIGNVLATSKRYYRSCAKWYFSCVVIISFVWPLLLNTAIPYWTIWGVVFFQGISGVLTFCYTSTIINYLVASGRNYINNNIHICATVLTYFLKIWICLTNLNIIWISLSMIAVNVGKCFVYGKIMKKYSPEYEISAKVDLALLKERNSYLIHEISGVVFSSTDTILISIFCGLREASIYAVYYLALASLKTIIDQVFVGTNFILGDSYASNKETYPQTHDCYNSIYITAVFSIYTVAYLLLLPFISLYTTGINDANYLDPKLSMLFVLLHLLSSCRIVDGQLIKISFHAKQTISRSIAEAFINLTASLILVQVIGIYGVLCGTVLALLYRANDIVLYANHRILYRSAQKEYCLYAVNFAVFFIFGFLNTKLSIQATSYFQLAVWAAVVSICVGITYILVNLLTNSQLRMIVQKRYPRYLARRYL